MSSKAMSSSSSTTGDIHREVNPRIWPACADDSVKIPLHNARVYYFPQGHAEHCCGSLSPFISPRPSITAAVPCLVSSIDLLTDPVTDEVFVHLLLQPQPLAHSIPTNPSTFWTFECDKRDTNKLTTYTKTLSASDVSGPLAVPRKCAESVFPPLNSQENHPAQALFIKDMHGVVWEFRHVCRVAQANHFLTTGWSNFVKKKKLMAGDSLIFMRNSADELFFGIRRIGISNDSGYEYKQSSGGDVAKEEFRRTGKGKLTAEAVSDAINKVVKGIPFEVVYYPTHKWSEFVVRAEDVEVSMAVEWTPGTRVKMAMVSEDSWQISWFEGTVSSTYKETGLWGGSLWKQLQITWDKPEDLKHVKRVNPWQLEIVFPDSKLQGVRNNEFGSSNPQELRTNNNIFNVQEVSESSLAESDNESSNNQ